MMYARTAEAHAQIMERHRQQHESNAPRVLHHKVERRGREAVVTFYYPDRTVAFNGRQWDSMTLEQRQEYV